MITTIIENKENIIQLVSSVIGIFAVIAAMTPNDSDNKVLSNVLKVINALGFNFGKASNK